MNAEGGTSHQGCLFILEETHARRDGFTTLLRRTTALDKTKGESMAPDHNHIPDQQENHGKDGHQKYDYALECWFHKNYFFIRGKITVPSIKTHKQV